MQLQVLISKNGTGKTSPVLEAVPTHSRPPHRFALRCRERGMIRNGEAVAEVHGVVFQIQRRVRS